MLVWPTPARPSSSWAESVTVIKDILQRGQLYVGSSNHVEAFLWRGRVLLCDLSLGFVPGADGNNQHRLALWQAGQRYFILGQGAVSYPVPTFLCVSEYNHRTLQLLPREIGLMKGTESQTPGFWFCLDANGKLVGIHWTCAEHLERVT